MPAPDEIVAETPNPFAPRLERVSQQEQRAYVPPAPEDESGFALADDSESEDDGSEHTATSRENAVSDAGSESSHLDHDSQSHDDGSDNECSTFNRQAMKQRITDLEIENRNLRGQYDLLGSQLRDIAMMVRHLDVMVREKGVFNKTPTDDREEGFTEREYFTPNLESEDNEDYNRYQQLDDDWVKENENIFSDS